MGKNPKPHELRKRDYRIQHSLERVSKPRLLLPGRHLFVTEGVRTEPNYLRGMINEISAQFGAEVKNQLQILPGGDNTLNLLRRAENYQSNASDEFQHIWILYDQDSFPESDFDNTMYRCQALTERAKERGMEQEFHAVWSNECVELWFVLHFRYLDSRITRWQYEEMLGELLGKKYQKDDPALFCILRPYLSTAIKNAKKLAETFSLEQPPSQQLPCTQMFTLLEYFLPYISNTETKAAR